MQILGQYQSHAQHSRHMLNTIYKPRFTCEFFTCNGVVELWQGLVVILPLTCGRAAVKVSVVLYQRLLHDHDGRGPIISAIRFHSLAVEVLEWKLMIL